MRRQRVKLQKKKKKKPTPNAEDCRGCSFFYSYINWGLFCVAKRGRAPSYVPAFFVRQQWWRLSIPVHPKAGKAWQSWRTHSVGCIFFIYSSAPGRKSSVSGRNLWVAGLSMQVSFFIMPSLTLKAVPALCSLPIIHFSFRTCGGSPFVDDNMYSC